MGPVLTRAGMALSLARRQALTPVGIGVAGPFGWSKAVMTRSVTSSWPQWPPTRKSVVRSHMFLPGCARRASSAWQASSYSSKDIGNGIRMIRAERCSRS